MKEKNTGVMVSFTLGAVVGLYGTSKEVREHMNGLGQKLFGQPNRHIIEGECELSAHRSHAGIGSIRHFGQSLKNHVMAASRARIIKKNRKK